MTRKEKLATEPGRELDTLVGKAIGEIQPIIVWDAMDKDDRGYFIRFTNKIDAEKWLKDIKEHMTLNSIYDGVHLVQREIFKPYSTDISAAWEIFTHWGWQGRVDFCSGDWYCEIMIGINDAGYSVYRKGTGKTAPEAICRAALFAIDGDTP